MLRNKVEKGWDFAYLNEVQCNRSRDLLLGAIRTLLKSWKKPCSPEINDHVHPNPLGGPQHSPHVKCPLLQYIFSLKLILAPVGNMLWPFFSIIFLTNPAFLQASKHAKNQASSFHNRVRRGVGLLLIWCHILLCMYVHKESMQCKSVCDSKSIIDLLLF